MCTVYYKIPVKDAPVKGASLTGKTRFTWQIKSVYIFNKYSQIVWNSTFAFITLETGFTLICAQKSVFINFNIYSKGKFNNKK